MNEKNQASIRLVFLLKSGEYFNGMKEFLKEYSVRLFVVIVICLFFIGNSEKKSIPKSDLMGTTTENREQTNSGLSARLRIPAINVDASIESVGLTSEGNMAVPQVPSDVAWYNLGSYPGEEGSAVMAGHVNWKNGVTGVFANLEKLRPGDTLSVENDQGKVVSFVVTGSRLYDAEADATPIFSSDAGKHLNLITCSGDWNRSEKSYAKRLVIFTDAIIIE